LYGSQHMRGIFLNFYDEVYAEQKQVQ